MRALLLSLVAVLPLGFATHHPAPQAIYITTAEESSITIYVESEESGEEVSTVIGNRSFLSCVPDGAVVGIEDLSSPGVFTRIGDRAILEGNLELTVTREGGETSRIRVVNGKAEIGPEDQVSPRAPFCKRAQ